MSICAAGRSSCFWSENGVVQCKLCSDKIVYYIPFSLILFGLGLLFSLGPYELFDVNIKPQLPWVISVLIRFNQFIWDIKQVHFNILCKCKVGRQIDYTGDFQPYPKHSIPLRQCLSNNLNEHSFRCLSTKIIHVISL